MRSPDLAQPLDNAADGSGQALDSLFEVSYRELQGLARARLRANARPTALDTTALVHECYLRVAAAGRLRLPDRARFLGYASRVMRCVIIDLIRKARRQRAGGGSGPVTLTTSIGASAAFGTNEILRLHDVLDSLAKLDPRMAQVVEMRYFGGLTETEIAAALGVTERTVRRDWERARLWLAAAMK